MRMENKNVRGSVVHGFGPWHSGERPGCGGPGRVKPGSRGLGQSRGRKPDPESSQPLCSFSSLPEAHGSLPTPPAGPISAVYSHPVLCRSLVCLPAWRQGLVPLPGAPSNWGWHTEPLGLINIGWNEVAALLLQNLPGLLHLPWSLHV